jgi:hypothetical protein
MRSTISTAAYNSAAMTGVQEWKEDPYALSDHNFGHDMAKQADLFARQRDRDDHLAMLDVMKAQALGKYKNPDGTYSDINGNQVPPPGETDALGTSVTDVDEFTKITDQYAQVSTDLDDKYAQYTGDYYSTLQNILNDKNSTTQDKVLAESTLINIFGKYTTEGSQMNGPHVDPLNTDPDFVRSSAIYNSRDRMSSGEGKVIHAGWDVKTKSFRDHNGNKIESPEDFKNYMKKNGQNLSDYYTRTKAQMTLNKNVKNHKGFIEKASVQQMDQDIQTDKLTLDATRTLFNRNVLNIKKNLKTRGLLDNSKTITGQISEEDVIDLFVGSDGKMITRENFIKSYNNRFKDRFKQYPGGADRIQGLTGKTLRETSDPTQDAGKLFDGLAKKFKTAYNSGVVVTGADGTPQRLVKSTTPDYQTGSGVGGLATKAMTTTFSGTTPNSNQTRGTLSFITDALNSSNLVVHSGTPLTDMGDVRSFKRKDPVGEANLKAALAQIKASLLTGDKKLIGSANYLGIALSNPNMNGLNITLPTEYLQQFKGNKMNPSWADKLLAAGGGLTIYAPKTDLKTSTFTKTSQQGKYDFINSVLPIPLEIPGGGTLTISPRSQNGMVEVNGSLEYIDSDGLTKGIPFHNLYPAETSVDNLVNSLNTFMITNKNSINLWRQQRPSEELLKNYFQLPQIKSKLDTKAGDDVPQLLPLDIFLNSLNQLNNGR